VPSERTEITEITTGLGTLGISTVQEAVAVRPATLTNVRDDQWDRLERLLAMPTHQLTFATAFANGQAFAVARDGLRGRRPIVVEWKGPHGSVGDQVAPVDLRVDHVYLISCKYLSRILLNVAPASLFDHGLLGAQSRSRLDWYQEVAPLQYQELYRAVCHALDLSAELPGSVDQLSVEHRRILKPLLKDGWPGDSRAAYSELTFQVSAVSATRWRRWLRTRRDQAAMLWRLLRISSAPYFVLGASAKSSLRLRIATPWDWQQNFELRDFDAWADSAGQPVIRWRASVQSRAASTLGEVHGHIEIRWSHGRFAQPPEAKVYLDSPHQDVPGYVPLV
jgi:hypothetical protein